MKRLVAFAFGLLVVKAKDFDKVSDNRLNNYYFDSVSLDDCSSKNESCRRVKHFKGAHVTSRSKFIEMLHEIHVCTKTGGRKCKVKVEVDVAIGKEGYCANTEALSLYIPEFYHWVMDDEIDAKDWKVVNQGKSSCKYIAGQQISEKAPTCQLRDIGKKYATGKFDSKEFDFDDDQYIVGEVLQIRPVLKQKGNVANPDCKFVSNESSYFIAEFKREFHQGDTGVPGFDDEDGDNDEAADDDECEDLPIHTVLVLDASPSMEELWPNMKHQIQTAATTIASRNPKNVFSLYRMGKYEEACEEKAVAVGYDEFTRIWANETQGDTPMRDNWPLSEEAAVKAGWEYVSIDSRNSVQAEASAMCQMYAYTRAIQAVNIKTAVVLVTDDYPLLHEQHPREELEGLQFWSENYVPDLVPDAVVQWNSYHHPTLHSFMNFFKQSGVSPFFAIAGTDQQGDLQLTNHWWREVLTELGYDVAKHYQWFHPAAKGLGEWIVEAAVETVCNPVSTEDTESTDTVPPTEGTDSTDIVPPTDEGTDSTDTVPPTEGTDTVPPTDDEAGDDGTVAPSTEEPFPGLSTTQDVPVTTKEEEQSPVVCAPKQMSVFIRAAQAGKDCFSTAACQRFVSFHRHTVDDVDFYQIKAAQEQCASSTDKECPTVLKAVATFTRSDICHVKEAKQFLIDSTLFEGFKLLGPVILGTKGEDLRCAKLTMTKYDLAKGTEFSCSPKVVHDGSQDVILTRRHGSENEYSFQDRVVLGKLLNFEPVDPACPLDIRRARQHIVSVLRIF